MDDNGMAQYGEFLESLVRAVLELKPETILVQAIGKDGSAFTAAYGDVGPFDMLRFASHMQADAMVDIVKANARDILAAAEEEEDA